MQKSTLACIAFGLMLLFSSAKTDYSSSNALGDYAPNLQLNYNTNKLSIQQFRGRYIVLQFWNSLDPQSRISNRNLANVATKRGMAYIGVNFDRSEALKQQLCAIDGLDTTIQVHVDQQQAHSIRKQWNIGENYHSYLINPQGRIIAIDPSAEELMNL